MSETKDNGDSIPVTRIPILIPGSGVPSGRRRLEVPDNHDEIVLGEKLPDEYDLVLRELDANSQSKTFTEQAKRVIYYFYALDSEKRLIDENGVQINLEEFASLLASLPFVNTLYVARTRTGVKQPQGVVFGEGKVVRRGTIDVGNPDTSFPSWIRDRVVEGEQVFRNDYSNLQQFYEDWTKKQAVDTHRGDNDVYSFYSESITPEKSEKIDERFKLYVEADYSPEKLNKVFEKLALSKSHPHESKMFEGNRLVMYWQSTPSPRLISDIKNAFESEEVEYRGPGQDSTCLVEKNGEVKKNLRTSNDGALGEGGYSLDFDQEEFDPIVFLKKYLEQCYNYWRNPINPYQLSYFPLFKESPEIESEVIDYWREKVGSELVVIDGRVLRLFEN